MKPITDPAVKKALKGRLPLMSVDTAEEAEALIELAIERGELFRREDGALIETTLMYEQTLENLYLAGERLASLHKELTGEAEEDPAQEVRTLPSEEAQRVQGDQQVGRH